MASLSNDGGLRRILVFTPRGKREPIRLGRIPLKQAQGILRHVENLSAAAIDGSAPPEETSRWLAGIDATLRARLAKLQLAAPAEAKVHAMTLAKLVEHYQSRAGWKNLKPGTQKSSARAMRLLLQHFDPTLPIREVTVAAAADFYAALLLSKTAGGMGQAVATANLIASIVSTLFNYAIDAELVDRNPFKKLPRGARRGNNAMVSLADSLAVLKAISSTEDRLLFGLARWGGLRTISEMRGLRWGDIDWERKRFLVHSPKTERHEGRATRWVPIFPELAPLFEKHYDAAPEGELYVLPSYRQADKSKVTTMLRAAIRRSGVDRWPRLFHSLRATRQTELQGMFPAHVANSWIGNTADVADRHYLMTLDSHFEQAAQNAAQHMPASSGTDKKASETAT